MNDSVFFIQLTTTASATNNRVNAVAWLEENVGRQKYSDTVQLYGTRNEPVERTVGKPKHVSKFSKTVKNFKATTGLKLGAVNHITYWKGDEWIVYVVMVNRDLYLVVKADDPLYALQCKLAIL